MNQFKKKTGKTSPANAKKSKINDESTQNPENEIKHIAENTFQNLNGNSATDIIKVKHFQDIHVHLYLVILKQIRSE